MHIGWMQFYQPWNLEKLVLFEFFLSIVNYVWNSSFISSWIWDLSSIGSQFELLTLKLTAWNDLWSRWECSTLQTPPFCWTFGDSMFGADLDGHKHRVENLPRGWCEGRRPCVVEQSSQGNVFPTNDSKKENCCEPFLSGGLQPLYTLIVFTMFW